MAKNNNLSDFLTDIADAIREKKGTNEPINAQNFSSEILSIETNITSSSTVSEKDVNIRNYDGTIIYSYTKDEFLLLEELPPVPIQDNYICTGYNYSLVDAQNEVTKFGSLDIGGIFITKDGKSRMYINILSKKHLTVPLYFLQYSDNPVIIDWGDGSPTETAEKTWANISHKYTKIGQYVITFDGYISFGSASSKCGILGTNSGICNILTKIELGSEGEVGEYGFSNCSMLELVTGNLIGYKYAFKNCSNIKYICLTKNIGTSTFENCSSLSVICAPIKGVDNSSFSGCTSLNKIQITSNNWSLVTASRAFNNCSSLSRIDFDNLLSTSSGSILPTGIFSGCSSLRYIKIPKKITSISDNALNLPNACIIDMTNYTSEYNIPSLTSANSISIPSYCKIVIADGTYSNYKSQRYWIDLLSYIVEESEFYA